MTTATWAFMLLLAATADAAKPPLPHVGLEFRWMDGARQQKFLHVERVTPNGPAARAGLRPGDLITHMGGVPVDFGDELDFLIFIRERKPNERLVLKITRTGKPLEVIVTLGMLPEAARAAWEQGFRVAQQKRLAARGAK
jgi:S1-C subfamily serine protease